MKKRTSLGGGALGLEFESDMQDLEGFEEIDPMAEVNRGVSSNTMRGGRGSNASNISSCSSRRNSLGLRRRSSFGGAIKLSAMSNAEQTRVTDMYKTVIKLSSENKINEKNSWNFDLIDYMGSIIKEESSNQRGVNFQKASCTLDASVKIYSNRVDDTYTTSHRVLESLSRNGGPEEADDDDDSGATGDNGDDAGKKKKKESRVGSKSASNRLQISDTIERNLDTINSSHLEHESLVDPMFHLMSKAFDEGGAKGMLMANIRMPENRCCILFNPCDTSADLDAEDRVGMIDVTDLLRKPETAISLAKLALPSLCPPLDNYRATLEISESDKGVVTVDYFNSIVNDQPFANNMVMASNRDMNNNANNFNNYTSDDYDNDDNGDCGDYGFEADDGTTLTKEIDEFGNFNFDDTQSDFKVKSNARKSLDAKKSPMKQKINWDIVNSNSSKEVTSDASTVGGMAVDAGAAAELPDDLPWIDASATIVPTVGNNAPTVTTGMLDEYGYFDMFEAKNGGTGNDWAGAKHWKYATRSTKHTANPVPSAAPANPNSMDADEAAAGNKSKSKAAKAASAKDKEKFSLDLSVAPNESLLAPPKNRFTTLLTNANIEKMEQSAAQGEHLLPPDAHVSIRDLCRLYSSPHMLLPPLALQSIFEKMFSSMTVSKNQKEVSLFGSNKIKSSNDILWRKPLSSAGSVAIDKQFDNAASSNNEETVVWNDDGDDGNDYCPPESAYEPSSSENMGTNSISTSAADDASNSAAYFDFNNLIQANRKVEKIDIKYATVSKRVNVKKLKEDLWSHLDKTLSQSTESVNENIDENINPNLKRRNGQPKRNDDESTANLSQSMEKISMKEAITLMSENETQKEVTFPFYFICLLHLANEHNLKIENIDRNKMDDLLISSGDI